jgi:hypothetical protein
MPVQGGALQLPYPCWLLLWGGGVSVKGVLDLGHSRRERLKKRSYHPSPQEASLRPQSPSPPQQAPHVGVQTQSRGVLGPQVPSSVISPVCHGGMVLAWEATMRENRSPRTTREAYMAVLCHSLDELDSGMLGHLGEQHEHPITPTRRRYG